MKFAETDQAKVGEIRSAVGETFCELRQPFSVLTDVESRQEKAILNEPQNDG